MAKPKVSIDILGEEEVEEYLRTANFKIRALVVDEVNATAVNIQTQARKNLTKQKVVDTGRLRSSVRFTITRDGLVAEIGSDVAYAAYIEYGTGPQAVEPAGRYFPPPGVLLDWMRRHKIPAEAEYAIRRHLFFNGTKPRPYLTPAWEEERPKYLDRVRAAVKSGTK